MQCIIDELWVAQSEAQHSQPHYVGADVVVEGLPEEAMIDPMLLIGTDQRYHFRHPVLDR